MKWQKEEKEEEKKIEDVSRLDWRSALEEEKRWPAFAYFKVQENPSIYHQPLLLYVFHHISSHSSLCVYVCVCGVYACVGEC